MLGIYVDPVFDMNGLMVACAAVALILLILSNGWHRLDSSGDCLFHNNHFPTLLFCTLYGRTGDITIDFNKKKQDLIQ